MDPKVLYEDEFLVAVDKPSGMMVHADGRSKEKTLVDWINENYPEISEVGEEQILQNGEKITRPGIVHRLDKETSGVILIAKTQETHQFLKEQFQNRKVQKIYNAVVWGSFSEEKTDKDTWYTIDKPIGRSASDFRRWSAEFGAKGELREAVTEYKVLAQRSFNEVGLGQINNPLNPPYIKGETRKNNNSEGFSYLEIKPKTGRTHQIRVHMKAISHPVVCDKLYSNKVCSPESCLGFSRLALHALSISLELPPARTSKDGNGSHIKIESELPKEFEEAKKILS